MKQSSTSKPPRNFPMVPGLRAAARSSRARYFLHLVEPAGGRRVTWRTFSGVVPRNSKAGIQRPRLQPRTNYKQSAPDKHVSPKLTRVYDPSLTLVVILSGAPNPLQSPFDRYVTPGRAGPIPNSRPLSRLPPQAESTGRLDSRSRHRFPSQQIHDPKVRGIPWLHLVCAHALKLGFRTMDLGPSMQTHHVRLRYLSRTRLLNVQMKERRSRRRPSSLPYSARNPSLFGQTRWPNGWKNEHRSSPRLWLRPRVQQPSLSGATPWLNVRKSGQCSRPKRC